MFSGWNHGAGRSLPGNGQWFCLKFNANYFSGNPGNCQMLMRSSVLAIALILICINISHTGLFFFREGSQKEKAYSESTLVPMNDNFHQVESVFWSVSMIILFQDSKAGKMSLSPTLFCYNIQQKFRCDISSISFSQKFSYLDFTHQITSDRGCVEIIGCFTIISKQRNNFRCFFLHFCVF